MYLHTVQVTVPVGTTLITNNPLITTCIQVQYHTITIAVQINTVLKVA